MSGETLVICKVSFQKSASGSWVSSTPDGKLRLELRPYPAWGKNREPLTVWVCRVNESARVSPAQAFPTMEEAVRDAYPLVKAIAEALRSQGGLVGRHFRDVLTNKSMKVVRVTGDWVTYLVPGNGGWDPVPRNATLLSWRHQVEKGWLIPVEGRTN